MFNYCIFISHRCRKNNPNPVAVRQSKKIVLNLLAYPMLKIRQVAYNAVVEIVKVSFIIFLL